MPIIPLGVAKPGDLVFTHAKGVLDRAIRWLTRGKYSHVAVLDRLVDGTWYLIQATARGVTMDSPLGDDPTGYDIVGAPPEVNRDEELAFLRAQVGRKYGFVTVVSILFTLATPKFLNVMWPDTWICSALAGEGLRAGGWVHNWPDIYQVDPQQLFDALEAA